MEIDLDRTANKIAKAQSQLKSPEDGAEGGGKREKMH